MNEKNKSSEIKAITEEDNRDDIEQWFSDAKEQTFETLPEFIRHVMNDYIHDYGTVVHAIGACAVATAWACDRMDGARGGITGFQASFVMWDFVRRWSYNNNKCGLRLVDFDNLLYPQYADRFAPTISKSTWESVQKQAKEELSKLNWNDPFSPANRVIEHWKSIADGNVPFGLTVVDDD